MADGIQIVIERGKKKAVAYAPSWPGLSRGASSIDGAIEKLASYADRYRGVAALAGLSGEFPLTPVFDIAEEVPGRGMTDFWGISFAASTSEQGQMVKRSVSGSSPSSAPVGNTSIGSPPGSRLN